MALPMRLGSAAETSSVAALDVFSGQCGARRMQHEQHGSRGSTFFSAKAPSLRAQQRQRRSEAAGAVVSATALRPQREAQAVDAAEQSDQSAAASAAAALQTPRQTATVPDERRDQRLRDRELRQSRGGQEAEEYALRQCVQLHEQRGPKNAPFKRNARWEGGVLDDAYRRAGVVTSEYAKTFYLGTKLMTPEKARAVWAIYVWCRRTDELVDGPNASRITPEALDRWEERLEGIFDGRPYDILDAALTDTVSQYPVHIQPFRDMIDGMRMDLVKSRYQTYDELYGYCYKVAGTVALMTTPVMGINPQYKGDLESVYRAALALGTANQLTNILRDVGEDVNERNRIYVPLDELDQFGIRESEVVNGMFSTTTGRIDDRWRRFMQFQIKRTRDIFASAEAGVDQLAPDARLPVWSALILYRQILDSIEGENDYNNFTKRAYVKKYKKFLSLPSALLKSWA